MQYATCLIFEFHPGCNLGNAHPWCPNRSSHRWQNLSTAHTLTDNAIVRLADEAWHEHGFRGLFGFHYYNEPMLQWKRLLKLKRWIRSALPQSEFVLWTNGTQIRPDMREALADFARVMVTDYGNIERYVIDHTCPHVEYIISKQDTRLGLMERFDPDVDAPGCWRPFTEFVIDYHGNVHLCCYDWRGLSSPGNVLEDGLTPCIERWQVMRHAIVMASKVGDMPEACQRCPRRDIKLQAYSEAVGQKALDYVTPLLKMKERELCLSSNAR